MKKIVYIAHPISGDAAGNIARIEDIYLIICRDRPDVVPFAPYLTDCRVLDDSNPDERARGIQNSSHLLQVCPIDEVWLFGSRLSNGMKAEIDIALKRGIPVVAKGHGLSEELEEYLKAH